MPPCLTANAFQLISAIKNDLDKNIDAKDSLNDFFNQMGTHSIEKASVGSKFVAVASMDIYETER